jgi:two-component system response regulator YesN
LFKVDLPLQASSDSFGQNMCTKPSLISADLKRILVVDDDQHLLFFFEQLLVGPKYAVVGASTGEDALKKMTRADEHAFDLVILDYLLPDTTGIEVLKQITKLNPSIPTIFMTGFGNEDVAVQALRYGACDYLKKPFNGSDLIERIEFSATRKSADEDDEKIFVLNGCRTWNSQPAASSSRYSGRMQKALEYIDENYQKKINLMEVAQAANMSKFHFSRLFKRQVGSTYQDYVNNRRIETAKHYLRSGSLLVKEIAFAVGYNDVRNFIYVFKKITGATPSQFKRAGKPLVPNKIDRQHLCIRSNICQGKSLDQRLNVGYSRTCLLSE